MIGSAPLRDAPGDRELHIPRAAEDQVVGGVTRGLNVFLVSKPGNGLTTSLRFIASTLRQAGWATIQANARIEPGPLSLLKLVAFELATSRRDYASERTLTAAMVPPPVGNDESFQALALIRALRSVLLPLDQKTVVIVDGASPNQVQALFGRLRDEVWDLPVKWVVSGEERARGRYLAPPADAFFELQTELESMAPEQLMRLMSLRLATIPDRDLIAIANSVETPREALSILRLASERNTSPAKLAAQRAARLERAGKISPSAALLLAELENGPASAADPDLLARLGWSRQRVYQVFQQLEKAGLVEAGLEAVRNGRPRRTYRVVRS